MFCLSMATVIFLLWGFEAKVRLTHLDLRGVSPDDRQWWDDLSGELATPGKR